MRYPGNYGFIPHTLSGDGDPCDVIVANTRAIVPGADHELQDRRRPAHGGRARRRREAHRPCRRTKLTKRYADVHNYSDLPEITVQQIEHFFAHYKDLEPNKWVKIIRWGDAEEARKLVLEGVERAKKAKG